MKFERSIVNFEKKLNRVDPVVGIKNKTGLSSWKGRQIIPLDDWIELRDTPYALEYFPDDFDQTLTCMSGDEIITQREQEDLRKWDSDYQELMEYTKNPNYGRLKCFHCLLSPDGDDPIFIGINRLVAKGLNNDTLQRYWIQYPCQVVNRFQCPFERSVNGKDKDIGFDADDLFRLGELAFAVEFSLAKARKDDSEIRIKKKEELLHTLTNKESFSKILDQGAEAHEVGENITSYLRKNQTSILNYFMRIKDLVYSEELRFY